MLKYSDIIGKDLLIATSNEDKFTEISKFLNSFDINILNLKNYSKLNLKEPEENGDSFKANSLIKAKYYAMETKTISLADDSGLCIKLLNDQPGIYSARWAICNGKKDFTFAFEKIKNLLIESSIDIYNEHIYAYFVCAITIYDPSTNFFKIFEGRIDGKITFDWKTGGFGYDPIFIPNDYNKTFAQISLDQKNKISHRANAFNELLKFLNFI